MWRSSKPVLSYPWLPGCRFHRYCSFKTAGFEGYLAGLRGMGIGQANMPQGSLFLLRFSHFSWKDTPGTLASLVYFQSFEKVDVDFCQCSHCFYVDFLRSLFHPSRSFISHTVSPQYFFLTMPLPALLGLFKLHWPHCSLHTPGMLLWMRLLHHSYFYWKYVLLWMLQFSPPSGLCSDVTFLVRLSLTTLLIFGDHLI